MSVSAKGLDIVLLLHTSAYFILISACEYLLCIFWQIKLNGTSHSSFFPTFSSFGVGVGSSFGLKLSIDTKVGLIILMISSYSCSNSSYSAVAVYVADAVASYASLDSNGDMSGLMNISCATYSTCDVRCSGAEWISTSAICSEFRRSSGPLTDVCLFYGSHR